MGSRVALLPGKFFLQYFQNDSDFSRLFPIFRTVTKLSGFFRMISHFLDVFKTVHLGHWYFKADRPPSITFDWEIKNAFERNITVVQLETLGKKTHVKFSKRPQNHLISQSKVIKGGTGGEGGQFALCVKDPRIYPYDCQFSRWFQNCPDFSRWLPIFRMVSKLSGIFQMIANFPDGFKTVQIF